MTFDEWWARNGPSDDAKDDDFQYPAVKGLAAMAYTAGMDEVLRIAHDVFDEAWPAGGGQPPHLGRDRRPFFEEQKR